VRVQTTLIDRHTDVLQRVGPRPAEKLLEAAKGMCVSGSSHSLSISICPVRLIALTICTGGSERDIKLRLGHAVTGVDKSTVQLDDSTAEPYDVCLWATGMMLCFTAHSQRHHFVSHL